MCIVFVFEKQSVKYVHVCMFGLLIDEWVLNSIISIQTTAFHWAN